jgi:hypothetical protein
MPWDVSRRAVGSAEHDGSGQTSNIDVPDLTGCGKISKEQSEMLIAWPNSIVNADLIVLGIIRLKEVMIGMNWSGDGRILSHANPSYVPH